mgnify:FL=1
MITGVFMGTWNAGFITDALRLILASIDSVVYGLLGALYTVFFNVSTADFLTGGTIKAIYSRVQLIIGVFMVFKLAVTIIQGIMDPSKVSDKKAGYGPIVGRIVISLIMLSVITPINVPNPQNEWEEQLSNHGLAFGTLYSLQNRILLNNTLSRVIFGNDEFSTSKKKTTSTRDLTQAGQDFSKIILKSFFSINLLPESQWQAVPEGKSPESVQANWVCQTIDPAVKATYDNEHSTVADILTVVNSRCNTTGKLANIIQFASGEQYVFNYMFIISTVVGVILCFLIITYTLDVAIRAIKLMILRMIAPIPIISHMSISGKESKGQDSFSTWINALVTTYLELFIRLIVMFLIIFVSEEVLTKGTSIGGAYYSGSNWFTNLLSTIFIVLGLFFFGKQAPKFIQDSLGIKPSGGSIGLTIAAAGLGTLAGGGDRGNVLDNMRSAARSVQNGGKDPGEGQFKTYRDNQVKKLQDKFSNGIRDEYYRRGLDIDDQDGGYERKWWQSDEKKDFLGFKHGANVVDARSDMERLKNNQERYKANWQTHERATGRGVASRAGSDVHVRQDAYPSPTPAGTPGVAPSGPAVPLSPNTKIQHPLGRDGQGGTGFSGTAPATSAPTTSAPTPSTSPSSNPPALPPHTP